VLAAGSPVSGAMGALCAVPDVVAGAAPVLALLVLCCAAGCMRSGGPAPQPAMASPPATARAAAAPRVVVAHPVGINQFPVCPSAAST